MKKILCLFLLAVSSLNTFAVKVEGNKIVDDKGNTIEKKVYNKIVVLDPAVVEILYLIGGEDKIAAIGKTTMSKIYPEEKTRDLESVGTISKPSIEKILSYTPDLVVINGMATATGDTLKSLNIPYVVSYAGNIDAILENIETFGIIAGREEAATKLKNKSIEKLETMKARAAADPLKLKGTILYSMSPMMGFNKTTLPGEILSILGVENIADPLTGERPIISQEYLLKENPDFLAGGMGIKTLEEIKESNAVIKETTAGKKGNFLVVDSTKILRGSPRIFDEMEKFYEELIEIKNK